MNEEEFKNAICNSMWNYKEAHVFCLHRTKEEGIYTIPPQDIKGTTQEWIRMIKSFLPNIKKIEVL